MMENLAYQPVVKPVDPPARIGRINWTQTTTITVATFIGCLAALIAGVYVYKYLLSKKLAEKAAKLQSIEDQLEHQEGLLDEVVQDRKTIQAANQAAILASKAKPETKPQETGSETEDD